MRVARILCEYSQGDLGQRVGLDKSMISRIENGMPLGPEHQDAIADALGKTVEHLFPFDLPNDTSSEMNEAI